MRAPGSEPPKRRLPRPRPPTMPGPRLLTAICGALLCASGLFAFSGESIAPPPRPRPSSPRRSEVRAAPSLYLLCLQTWSKSRGPRRGDFSGSSRTEGGDALGCLRAGGFWPLTEA